LKITDRQLGNEGSGGEPAVGNDNALQKELGQGRGVQGGDRAYWGGRGEFIGSEEENKRSLRGARGKFVTKNFRGKGVEFYES